VNASCHRPARITNRKIRETFTLQRGTRYGGYAYQQRALGWPSRQRAKTLRRRVLAVAAQLIRTAGQWVLKLAAGWGGQADLQRVRAYLAALGP
jgi:hypothetical protein